MKKGLFFLFILFFAKSGMAQLPTCNWVTLPTSGGGQALAYANTYDANGNSFTIGAYQTLNGSIDLDPSTNTVSVNGLGIFVAKYDPSGQMLWAKPIGVTTTSISSSVSPRAIACDNQGNVYITGAISLCGIDFNLSSTSDSVYAPAGNSDMFFAKFDASGSLEWGYLIGAAANEEGTSIVCDYPSVYLSGIFGCYTDFDPSDSSFVPAIPTNCVGGFIAKYTTNGEFVWEGSLQGIPNGPAGYAKPNTIRIDGNHDLVAAGIMGGLVDFNWGVNFDTLNAVGGSDAFFAKYDTSGNFVFVKNLVTQLYSASSIMELDNSGNIVLAGYFNGAIDTDPSSTTNLLVSTNYSSFYEADAFIAKYDNDGNYIWSGSIGYYSGEDIFGIAIDQNDGILVSGSFRDSIDIDFGSGTYTLQAVGNNANYNDAFVAKYNANGNVLFGFPFTAMNNTGANDVDYYQNKFILTGSFGDLIDFDPTSVTLNVTPFAGVQFYHAQYTDPTVTGILPLVSGPSFSLFPNPVNDLLFISNWSDFKTYSIYTISGQIIETGTVSSRINVADLAPGVYVCVLINSKGDVSREKFIHQ